MFFEQFISGDNDNVLQNKGNVYIRRLHNDSKALFLPGTGGRVLSPLEDGIRDCLLSRGLGDVYKRQVRCREYNDVGIFARVLP